MKEFLSNIDWSVVVEVIIGYLSGKGILNARTITKVVLGRVVKRKPHH